MESRYGESTGGYYPRRRVYGESRGGESRRSAPIYNQTSSSNVSNSRIAELKAEYAKLQAEIAAEEERKRLEEQEEERLREQIRESQIKLRELRRR